MRKKDMRPYRPYGGRKKHPVLITVLCIILVLVLAFTALQVFIAANDRTQVSQEEPQVMVIFGCQVKPWGPSVLLQDRLDTALSYLEDHPDTTVICSGGKGDDEHLSEAACMVDYLRAHGFEGTVLREDRSLNTWQNVTYTRALLDREGIRPTGVVLVSNGFHLGRIRLLWGRAWGSEMTLSTLAAPSSHFPSAVKMFFREPFALVKSFLLDR